MGSTRISWRGRSSNLYITLFFVAAFFEPLFKIVFITEIILIINIYHKREYLIISRKESLLIFVLLATSILPLVENSSFGFFTYWHHCILTPIILYLSGKIIAKESDLIILSYRIALVSIVCISISIFLTPTQIEIKENVWTGEHTRIFRHFFAHNTIYNGTGVVIFLIPSFMAIIMEPINGLYKFYKIILIVLISYCVYKSESRSAVYFIFCILLYYFNRTTLKRRFEMMPIFLMVSLLGLLICYNFNINLIPERFTLSYSKEVGVTSRDIIWSSALAIISINPFGSPSPTMEILGRTFSTHNNFLTYWLLFGWFSGIVVVYVLLSIEYSLIRRVFVGKMPYKYLPYILTAVFFNFFVESPAISNVFAYAFYFMLVGYSMKGIKTNNVRNGVIADAEPSKNEVRML